MATKKVQRERTGETIVVPCSGIKYWNNSIAMERRNRNISTGVHTEHPKDTECPKRDQCMRYACGLMLLVESAATEVHPMIYYGKRTGSTRELSAEVGLHTRSLAMQAPYPWPTCFYPNPHIAGAEVHLIVTDGNDGTPVQLPDRAKRALLANAMGNKFGRRVCDEE